MADISVSERWKKNYDGYYDDSSEWRRVGAIDKARNIVELCSAYPHDRILEIGAGDGAILARLAETGFGKRLHALDISTSAIEQIRARNIPNLEECRTYSGYTLDYDQDAFDLVILSHVIEHLEYPRRLIYEAARVARTVFIEVPLEDTVRLPFDYVWDTLGHINSYNPKTIRRLIQTCGLQVDRQKISNMSRASYEMQSGTRGVFKYWIKEALLKCTPAGATRLLTYHAALVCRRCNDDDPKPVT